MTKHSLSGLDLMERNLNRPDSEKPIWERKGNIEELIRKAQETTTVRKAGRPKKAFPIRLRPMLTEEHLEIEHQDIAQITVNALRKTMEKRKLPRSARTWYRETQHVVMDNDCEDCRAIYSYARLMKVPLYTIRDIDYHQHANGDSHGNHHEITFVDLDDKVQDNDEPELRLYETLPSPEPSPEQSALNHELISYVSRLNLTMQAIIYERFWDGKTLDEVGTDLGYTKENVRRIQNRALQHLKERLTETTKTKEAIHGL